MLTSVSASALPMNLYAMEKDLIPHKYYHQPFSTSILENTYVFPIIVNSF